MALRLMLVGVVASMGLNVPEGREFEAIAHHCRVAWDASLARWDALMPAGEQAFQEDAIVAPAAAPIVVAPTPEQRFDAIVAGMASSFAADQSASPEPAPAVAAPQVEGPIVPLAAAEPTIESSEPVEDLYPGVAFALNREAEGLGLTLPMPEGRVAAERATAESPTEGQRLVEAVRLTAQAFHAWVTLVQGPADHASLR